MQTFDILGAGRVSGLRGLGGFMDEFDASISQANHDWEILASRLRSDVNAQIGPSVSLITNAVAFFRAIDQSSPDAIINSVAALIEQLGPVGQYASEALKALMKFANWVTGELPAYALQIQDQHLAHLDWWIGNEILGFTNPDQAKALQFQRLAGWAETIFAINTTRDWCTRSATWLGSMAPTPTNLESALDRWRWVAGPRADLIPRCTQWSVNYPDWYPSAEGRASVPVADSIASVLSGGDWSELTVRSGRCKVWKSRGLVLIFNMDQDINPGPGVYNVFLSGLKVNVSFLPDEMLSMLGTYYSLYYQLANILGGELGRDDRDRITRAAFGPDLQGLKKYHLLRLILKGDPSIGLGVLAEVGRRWGPGGKAPGGPSKKKSSSSWSTTKKVAVAGGVAAGGTGLYFLGRALRWWK